MESSQFSYRAPGPSYESPHEGDSNRPPENDGGVPPEPTSTPRSVPSGPLSADPVPPATSPPGTGSGPPSSVPGTVDPVPRGTAGPLSGAYPRPAAYTPYPPHPGYPPYPVYPSYPGYTGGYAPAGPAPAYPYGYGALPAVPPPRVVRHTLQRRTWMWVVLLTAVVAALVGGLVGALVGAGSQRTFVEQFFPNKSVLARPQDVQAVLAKVEPAVVSIDSQSASGSSGGDFVEAAGTGMILTPDGEVLTNDHVVTGATSVTVTLFGQTTAMAAHVLGTDPGHDLALVQIDHASNLPTVALGDSGQTQVGDGVLAIGNALALAGGPSVTEGIISAVGRSLTAQNDSGQTENLTGLLQTDAAINPGNSGGPLVDAQAQVVGMNTAVASSSTGNAPTQNIGFAIAIDSVKPLLAELQHGGPGGASSPTPQPVPVSNAAYMGVTVGPITPALKQQDDLTPSSGALVISVQPGSPADKAGLQVNDVIVSLNATAIQSPSDLTAAIHPFNPGDRVAVGVYRGSTKMTVDVTLGARPTGG
jgi:S1-C subfamily serine protease